VLQHAFDDVVRPLPMLGNLFKIACRAGTGHHVASMTYCRRAPRPPLSEFIELLWLFESEGSSHASERILPMGTIELVINLRHDTRGSFDAVVAGPHSRFFVLDTSRPTSVIGVHFKPGGGYPFFALPLDELSNQHVPLEALWSVPASVQRERLLAAEPGEAKLLLLERALLSVCRPYSRHAAIDHALGAFRHGQRRIADVVKEIGMSQRRFIHLFSDEVGLTPKSFCRVRRFQRAVGLLHRAQTVDWAETALACGYFDQSHMIHDFQDFAGLSPANYLSRRTVYMNHLLNNGSGGGATAQ
jgi:AraC-like DNA-binding protein